MIGQRLEKSPISVDHDRFVKGNGDLSPRRLRPVAKRRDGEGQQDQADDPDPLLPYGWPQRGQTGLPSMRFFLQCGHGTRLTFGREPRTEVTTEHYGKTLVFRSDLHARHPYATSPRLRTRATAAKSNQTRKTLRIRCARNCLWPCGQMDNQSNDRDQPTQNHDESPVRRLAAR
jgi:hypothetical protein